MRLIIYKETFEDWGPSFLMDDKKLLRVSLVELNPTNKSDKNKWRVCVWGADDFGMEKDFSDFNLALHDYTAICTLPNYLTRSFLKQLNFKNA